MLFRGFCVAFIVLCVCVLFVGCVLLFWDGSACLLLLFLCFAFLRFCVIAIIAILLLVMSFLKIFYSQISLAIWVLFGQRPGFGFTVTDLGFGSWHVRCHPVTAGDLG